MECLFTNLYIHVYLPCFKNKPKNKKQTLNAGLCTLKLVLKCAYGVRHLFSNILLYFETKNISLLGILGF